MSLPQTSRLQKPDSRESRNSRESLRFLRIGFVLVRTRSENGIIEKNLLIGLSHWARKFFCWNGFCWQSPRIPLQKGPLHELWDGGMWPGNSSYRSQLDFDVDDGLSHLASGQCLRPVAKSTTSQQHQTAKLTDFCAPFLRNFFLFPRGATRWKPHCRTPPLKVAFPLGNRGILSPQEGEEDRGEGREGKTGRFQTPPLK